MRQIKRFCLVLLTLLWAFSALAADNFPSPTGFVNDFAGILSPGQAQELQTITGTLKNRTGAELAIAIVKSVQPLDSKLYAVKLFENWKVGEKGKDNGVLILLAMEEKRIEIEVGYGLEGVLPDALAGSILDKYAIPYFKQGQMGEGVVAAAKAVSEVVSGTAVPEEKKPVSSEEDSAWPIALVIAGVIILALLVGRGGSITTGIIGAVFGFVAAGIIGSVIGALIGLFLGIGGAWRVLGGGGFGGGGFGGGGFGGFGGGRSGGGGAGRGW